MYPDLRGKNTPNELLKRWSPGSIAGTTSPSCWLPSKVPRIFHSSPPCCVPSWQHSLWTGHRAAVDPAFALVWWFAARFPLTFLHAHPRSCLCLRATCSSSPLCPQPPLSDFSISYLALAWDSDLMSAQIFSL